MSTNPKFVIVEAPLSVSGRPAQSITIPVKVKNVGGATGQVDVRILDHTNYVAGIASTTLGIGEERVIQVEVTLPIYYGEYAWKIQLVNGTTKTIDNSKNLIVYVYEKKPTSIELTITPL